MFEELTLSGLRRWVPAVPRQFAARLRLRALTSAREPKELNRGAHVQRPKRTVDVLVRGAVDGVDGAVTQLPPLTVE